MANLSVYHVYVFRICNEVHRLSWNRQNVLQTNDEWL